MLPNSSDENPVTDADQSGLMVYTTQSDPVYLLIQLEDHGEKIDIKINSEGISRSQSIKVLTAAIELLKTDADEVSVKVNENGTHLEAE